MRIEDREPGVVNLPEMKLVGLGARMSLARDATAALWKTLMPKRSGIENRVPDRCISMRVYTGSEASVAEMFAPATEFEKWAAVEVTDYGSVPAGLERYRLEGGDYAVFRHRGPARSFPDTMRYIFADWLPRSGFELDAREHFEVLRENWSADDEDAEEHIYVPIRKRQGA